MADPQQLEMHWLACMASLGGGGTVTRVPGGLVVGNPRVAGVMLNFVLLRTPSNLDAALEMGAAVLAGYGRRPALFLSPQAGDPAAAAESLAERGWKRSVRQSVLVCSLPVPAAAVSAEVAVSEVGRADLDVWGETLVEAYEVEPMAGREIRKAWTALFQQPGEGARARFYLARVDRTVSGTALSWSQGGITGLYCGAVLPAQRRRGVERAMVARRLLDAAAGGDHLAFLQTESGSPVEHLCTTHLGFRVAYHRELWLPA